MRFKLLKRTVAFTLLIALVMNMSIFASSETVPSSDSSQQLITAYFDCINNKKWNEWLDCYIPQMQPDRNLFISDKANFEANFGVLTIKKADVLEIVPISNNYVLSTSPELEQYTSDLNNFSCFRLRVNLIVNEENEFFVNGENNLIITLLAQNEELYVAALCVCPEDLLTENAITDFDSLADYKAATMNQLYLDFPRITSSLSKPLFGVSFLMPSKRNYTASPASMSKEKYHYMSGWLENDSAHSVYYINDTKGNVVGAAGFTRSNSSYNNEATFDFSTIEALDELTSYVDVFLQEFPLDSYNDLDNNGIDYINNYVEKFEQSEDYFHITVMTKCGDDIPCTVIASYAPEIKAFFVLELSSAHFTATEIMDIASSIEFTVDK